MASVPEKISVRHVSFWESVGGQQGIPQCVEMCECEAGVGCIYFSTFPLDPNKDFAAEVRAG